MCIRDRREVIYGAVKDFCKCKSNFNSAISIITLPHVQDPWNTVDGTKIQVIQPVFSAGKSQNQGVHRCSFGEIRIIAASWSGTVASADQKDMADLAGLYKFHDMPGIRKNSIVGESGCDCRPCLLYTSRCV